MRNRLLSCLALIISLLFFKDARAQVANLYIIHNCAEPALDTIDIYIDGVLYDSNFLFRTALPVQFLTDTQTTITLAHKHSGGVIADSIFHSFNYYSFREDSNYVLMISGLLDTGFAPNPDGLNTNLNIIEIGFIPSDTAAPPDSLIAATFFMGATDLPAVEVRERLSGTAIAPLMPYGDTSYVHLINRAHELQFYNPDSTPNYETYKVDLSGLAFQNIFVFTSGFLNPAANDSGAALAVLALINGGLYYLPVETAAFQLLHNCSDPAADSVDVYINGQLAYPNLPFQHATPALTNFAYSPYQVGIAPKNSTSINDTFWSDNFFFNRDTFYVATMSGLINPSSFASNPDGISTAFNVLMKVPAEYSSSSQQNLDFFFLNGVTDAGPLSVIAQGAGPDLASNIDYAGQSNYVSVPAEFYTLQLQDSLGNTLGNYFANFLAYDTQSAVLLTSGFINPSANQNGAPLGLYMSPISGGAFVPLFVTGIKSETENSTFFLFPNPTSERLFVRLRSAASANLSWRILDMQGRLVKRQINEGIDDLAEGVDVSNLSDGCYILQITDENKKVYNRFVVQK